MPGHYTPEGSLRFVFLPAFGSFIAVPTPRRRRAPAPAASPPRPATFTSRPWRVTRPPTGCTNTTTATSSAPRRQRAGSFRSVWLRNENASPAALPDQPLTSLRSGPQGPARLFARPALAALPGEHSHRPGIDRRHRAPPSLFRATRKRKERSKAGPNRGIRNCSGNAENGCIKDCSENDKSKCSNIIEI